MKVLHIEQWSEATNVFIQDLHAGTGCRIEHAASIDEGLSKIVQNHGNIDIAIYSVGPTPYGVLHFQKRVRTMTADALIRCPQLVALASSPLPLPYAAKCLDQQVIYLLRDSPSQVIETVKVMLWRIRNPKSGPTIRIEFNGGHYRFFICGLTTSEEIRVSAQIGKLLLLLLRGLKAYTVEMLAAELGISRQSVKKYMRDLRVIVESALKSVCAFEPIVDLVWMERGSGGTLCGMRAHPEWG
jgi:hypothetical protein